MLEDFFKTSLDLKKVHRRGWQNKLSLEHPESVADHSYSMTVMSMVLGDMMGLDSKKMMKMALLHDLAESQVGDLTPEDISKNEKIQIENKAMEKILSNLPSNLSKEYEDIWKEYQTKQTEESRLLHEIDKLEMAFQAKSYLNEGHAKGDLKSFFESAEGEIKNEEVKLLLDRFLEGKK